MLGLGLGNFGALSEFREEDTVWLQYKTVGGDEFRTSNQKNFRVGEYVPPPTYSFGDHEVDQTIDGTFSIDSTGQSTESQEVDAMGYRTWYNRNPGFLWSGDGKHLYTPVVHDTNSDWAIVDWEYATPWDLTSVRQAGTIEMIIEETCLSQYPPTGIMYGLKWDKNGNLVCLMVNINNTDYEYEGFDMNTPYQIQGEGTFAAADRTAVAWGYNNEGRSLYVDDTAFLLVKYDTEKIMKWGVLANGMPDFGGGLQQEVNFPDRPVGMGLTCGYAHFYDSGNKLICGAGSGGGGVWYGLKRYELSTPYDLTTIGSLIEDIPFDAATTNYRGTYGSPMDFQWSGDGTKYYWGGNSGGWGKVSQVTVI